MKYKKNKNKKIYERVAAKFNVSCSWQSRLSVNKNIFTVFEIIFECILKIYLVLKNIKLIYF